MGEICHQITGDLGRPRHLKLAIAIQTELQNQSQYFQESRVPRRKAGPSSGVLSRVLIGNYAGLNIPFPRILGPDVAYCG